MLWLSIFGGTAIHVELFGVGGLTEAVNQDLTTALYRCIELLDMGGSNLDGCRIGHYSFTDLVRDLSGLWDFSYLHHLVDGEHESTATIQDYSGVWARDW